MMRKWGVVEYVLVGITILISVNLVLSTTGFNSFLSTSPLFSPLANSLGAGTIEPLDTSDGGIGSQNEDGTCTIEAGDGGISESADELDTDCDGVPDNSDNCKLSNNPDQADLDHDGVGDECDNCVDRWNPDQRDSDGDGTGDGCDICPNGQTGNDANDDDGDGVPNACDNCRYKPNIDQTDIDRDGHGDVCDNCVYQNNRDQNDTDHDGIGDVCDDCSILPDLSPGETPSRDVVPGICSKKIEIKHWNVFVTNQTFDPILEQPKGRADTLCQIAAVQGGVVSYAEGEMGTYVAWLSTSTKNAKDKLTGDAKRPFVRPDGIVVANTKRDLLDGSLINPINVDEYGQVVPYSGPISKWNTWTGTNSDGTFFLGENNCRDWTSSASNDFTRGGLFNEKNALWTLSYVSTCSSYQFRLYCFQVSETMAACGDGFDNDGDTIIDWPNDPGCSSRTDGSEDNGYACSNGIDDDKDGLVDYPADIGCSSATDNDEWDKWIKVCTPQDLDKVRKNLDGEYLQICDIDLQGINFEPIGEAWDIWEPFTGTYDGNGYKIKNWVYSSISNYNNPVGLFRFLYGGVLKNIRLEGFDVSSDSEYGSTGALVGIASYETSDSPRPLVSNIYVNGIVRGGYYQTGGIVGDIHGGEISNSRFEGTVIGSNLVGGIVGRVEGNAYGMTDKAILRNLFAKGSIITRPYLDQDYDWNWGAGGVAGLIHYSDANNLSSNVTIYGDEIAGGLVGYMSYHSELVNSFSDSFVNGTYLLGGAVGGAWGEQVIRNIHSNSIVRGVGWDGGLVGYASGYLNQYEPVDLVSIIDSSSQGSVIGSFGLGGFAGGTNGAIVISSSSAVSVEGVPSSNVPFSTGLAGFIASASNTTIKSSYATGNSQGYQQVAGFAYAAYQNSKIEDSYALGSAVATNNGAGGFVSLLQDSSISRSYSVGYVNSPFLAGGLIGEDYNGVVISSYWDTQTSGQSTSAGGTGKTTSEMKAQSTYTGWDFANTWKIAPNEYPKLKWQA